MRHFEKTDKVMIRINGEQCCGYILEVSEGTSKPYHIHYFDENEQKWKKAYANDSELCLLNQEGDASWYM